MNEVHLEPGRAGVVGLLPAAGWATRLGPIGGSKEALGVSGPGGEREPVGRAALRSLARGGVARALVLLRRGKWDVPAALGAGGGGSPLLSYLATPATRSVVETLDLARPFVLGAEVVLAFPDCLFEPADAADRLLAHRARSGAAASLALFPSDRPEKTDMVAVDASLGHVTGFEVRPGAATRLRWTWLLASWGPEFTELLHAELGRCRESAAEPPSSLSLVFARAIEEGLGVDAVTFESGRFLDVGTPDDLERARA